MCQHRHMCLCAYVPMCPLLLGDQYCSSNVVSTITSLVDAVFADILTAIRLVSVCLGNFGIPGCVCQVALTLQPAWRKASTDPAVRCENGDPFTLILDQLDALIVTWAETGVNEIVDAANGAFNWLLGDFGYANAIPRLCLPTEGDRFRCECKVVDEAPPEQRTIGGDILQGLEDAGNDIVDFFNGRRLSHADIFGFTDQQLGAIFGHSRGRVIFTQSLANATAAFHGSAFQRHKLEQQVRALMGHPHGRKLFFSNLISSVADVNEDLANADPDVAAALLTNILSGDSDSVSGNENCLTNKEQALKAAQCEDPKVTGGLENLCFYARYTHLIRIRSVVCGMLCGHFAEGCIHCNVFCTGLARSAARPTC